MSINKHSIIFAVSLFFSVIFLIINLLFWFSFQYIQKENQQESLRRFLLADKIMRHEKSATLEHIMIQKSSISPQILLTKGRVVDELPFAKMVLFDGELYFLHTPPPVPLKNHIDIFRMPPPSHMKEEVLINTKKSDMWLVGLVIFMIDMLILFFFAYLMKKLIPLYNLKSAITLFRENDTHLNIKTDGYDEISQITREFNGVVGKMASIREARTLFLRNIMHELKTPIMKGSLISEDLEQKRLKQIFERMNYLIDEFSKIERFGSGEWELDIAKFRLVDILDHAFDLLLVNKKTFSVDGEENELQIDADFELFAIALKNLLDNALKYSKEKPVIYIKKDSIEICNSSEEIKRGNIDFSKPFNREYENSSNGLGLGLYLSNAVLNKHGYTLLYKYENNLSCFIINFTKGER